MESHYLASSLYRGGNRGCTLANYTPLALMDRLVVRKEDITQKRAIGIITILKQSTVYK